MFDLKLIMGIRFIARTAFVVVPSFITLPATAAAPSPVVHAGLSDPVKAWRKAMEAGDIAALARMHDADTVGFPPGAMSIKGADTIMKGYAETFAAYRAEVSFDDAHYVEQPPLVVSWGLFRLTLHPKAGGSDIVTRGRFTDAATQIDGGWRYIVDHASLPHVR